MGSKRSWRPQQLDEGKPASLAKPSGTTMNVTEVLEREGIELREVIGRGTYSNVRRAWSHRLRSFVAVKMIDRRTGSEFVHRFLQRELVIVRQLCHPNIMRVHQVVDIGSTVCLVEEYAEHSDLLRRIKRLHRIPEKDARPLFRQLIEALEYLRTQDVAHRDIKCENIFLDRFDNVKLGDFGFARRMRATDVSMTFCGSRAYVAPEILGAKPYRGSACDIWSAGVVLYVMVTGAMPYDDRYPRYTIEKQLQHRITYPRSLNNVISQDVKILIHSLLHPDPTQRAKHVDIVNSAWLVHTPSELRTSHVVDDRVGTAVQM